MGWISEHSTALLSILLLISELLPQTSAIKANSVFQLVVNAAKAALGKKDV